MVLALRHQQVSCVCVCVYMHTLISILASACKYWYIVTWYSHIYFSCQICLYSNIKWVVWGRGYVSTIYTFTKIHYYNYFSHYFNCIIVLIIYRWTARLPSWSRSGYSCLGSADSHHLLTGCIFHHLPLSDQRKESQVHTSSTGTSLWSRVIWYQCWNEE